MSERLATSPHWRHLGLDEREIERDARVVAKAHLRAQELTRKREAKQLALARKTP